MRKAACIALLLLADSAGCALTRRRSPDPAAAQAGVERLPPCADEPKPKKTFWQHIFPPEDERRANALPEDDGPHWGELGGG